MQTLNLLKTIKTIKTLTKLSLLPNNYKNYYNLYVEIFQELKFFDINMVNLLINKKSVLIYDFKLNFNILLNLHYLIRCFMNYSEFSNVSILDFYKDYSLNKYYSNYNISMLNTLVLKQQVVKNNLKPALEPEKIINIRREFKGKNLNVMQKTSIIDILLKKYIESITDSRVSINFDKYGIVFFTKRNLFVRALRRKLRRIKKMLRYSRISLRSFIRISLIFFCTKDIDIFARLLLKIMNAMHYKNHRRFLYYLKLFITKSMFYYFEVLKFEGFFFYLSGKISGGGNSKKKNYVVKCGKYSLTTKMLRLKYKKGLIHTKTGVLGYKFIISYN